MGLAVSSLRVRAQARASLRGSQLNWGEFRNTGSIRRKLVVLVLTSLVSAGLVTAGLSGWTDARRQAGVETEFHVYAGIGHGFGIRPVNPP